MKKWIFLLLMFLSSKALAQYESIFGNVSTSWNVFLEIIDAFETDSLSVVGDSAINKVEYKIVIGQFTKATYLVRESLDNSKVYLISPSLEGSEILILDLNLEKSDTFLVGPESSEILIVDSVYTLNEKKHIRFNYEIDFPLGRENLEFIEGVGTNFGMFFPGTFTYKHQLDHYLLCAYKNGELNYSNKSYYGICYISEGLGISHDSKKSKITLFPNPASDRIIIDLGDKQLHEQKLIIYDTFGRCLTTINLVNNSSEINISSLTSGFYYFTFFLNGEIITKKIIIAK